MLNDPELKKIIDALKSYEAKSPKSGFEKTDLLSELASNGLKKSDKDLTLKEYLDKYKKIDLLLEKTQKQQSKEEPKKNDLFDLISNLDKKIKVENKNNNEIKFEQISSPDKKSKVYKNLKVQKKQPGSERHDHYANTKTEIISDYKMSSLNLEQFWS